MTKVIKKEYKCSKCGTEYDVSIVLSFSSFLPKPDLSKIREMNKCPNCGQYYDDDIRMTGEK